ERSYRCRPHCRIYCQEVGYGLPSLGRAHRAPETGIGKKQRLPPRLGVLPHSPVAEGEEKWQAGRGRKRSAPKKRGHYLTGELGAKLEHYGLPLTGMCATIHVQDFPSHKSCCLQKQQNVHDFLYLSQSVNWMKTFQRIVSFRSMHRGVDDSCTDGIETNISVCIFDGETLGDCINRAFAEVRPESVQALHGLRGQGCRDAHHMAVALVAHL